MDRAGGRRAPGARRGHRRGGRPGVVGGHRPRGGAGVRPRRRRAGAARADLPPAGGAAQGARRSCCVEHREELYALSAPHRRDPRATPGSTSTAASACCSPTPARAKRELPNDTVLRRRRRSSRSARAAPSSASTSSPRCTGVAVQINAFNFPVWGLLEKLAPAFLAGVPSAGQAGHPDRLPDRARLVALIVDSGLLPDGRAAAGLRRRRRPARPPRRAGPGRVHRLGRHRAAAARAPGGGRRGRSGSTPRPTR